MSEIKWGVWVPNHLITYPPPHPLFRAILSNLRELDFSLIKKITLEAEKLGYDSIWICDHFSWEKLKVWFECWTTLSALSTITNKIRLGTIVLCNLYRHPSLAAMMGSTIDSISNGRLEFGIGAGWNEIECDNFGIEFPNPRKRLVMLKESVEIIKKLWTQETTTYIGKYYQIKDAYCEPKPIQKPHPPILIGGGGEKLTLKIVAKLADKSNFSGSINIVEKKINILKKYCKKINRDHGSIEKSINGLVVISDDYDEYLEEMKKRYSTVGETSSFKEWLKNAEETYICGTSENCIEKINQYVEIGITKFILKFGNVPKMDDMQLFAKDVITKI